jgi:cell division initiation protein
MRMSPLDIQNHRFRSAWRGLDPEEVESFLAAVAEDYAALVQEVVSSGDQIRRLEARLEELSLNEALLKETLVTAQNLGDELRSSAEKEARVRISEAEVKAEKILDAAHRRAGRLGEEIREMRGLRTRLASALRSSIETHLALVDVLSTDPETDEAFIEAEMVEARADRRSDDREPWRPEPLDSDCEDDPEGDPGIA